MKKLAILGIIFLSLNSFAQDMLVENSDQNKVLYRGFENTLTFGSIDSNSEAFEIKTINCEVSKLEGSENTYIAKTKSSARNAQISLFSDGKIVETTNFKVQNLPGPSLYWGNQKTGSTISILPQLEIKYEPGITLEANFEILSWECGFKDKTFQGRGNLLYQGILNHTKSMAAGEIVSIIVRVKSEDGVARKIAGSWVKE